LNLKINNAVIASLF